MATSSLAKRAGSSRSADARGVLAVLVTLLIPSACTGDKDTPGAEPSASSASSLASSTPSAEVSASPPPAPSSSSVVPVLVTAAPPLPKEDLYPTTLSEQRDAMLERMKATMRLSDVQLGELRAILEKSRIISQGNPEITEYAMTRRECRSRREQAGVIETEAPICGGPFMAPLWNEKAGETESSAKICIDRYEFPGIPCEYPVTWASAREAAQMCKAVGKRLCDAHEWEGACAGSVLSPDVEYAWGKPRKEMKNRHNADREIIWAYGAEKNFDRCAMSSKKSKKCTKSGWKHCGSNTYPAGAFPECKSPFGVYDQHGNVAEHMNMPLKPDQLGSRGGSGETEMKGSWFIFKKYEAHTDDCRWRAPDWHATKVMSQDSHQNYHLGFRCCKDTG